MRAPDPAAVPSLIARQPRRVAPTRPERAARLSPVADLQLGIVGRGQLYDSGWTTEQVRNEVDRGRWTVLAPGVVALQNAAPTRDQLCWLGVLHAGPSAVLSHETACALGGLSWPESPLIHVMTPKGDLVSDLSGFRFHQTRRHYSSWVVRGDGPARLDVEHAVLLSAERDHHVRRAIGMLAAAVQQRLTTPEQLLLAIDQIRKLRHGALFRLALGDIAGGAQSFAEIDVGRLCDRAGLAPPVRQRLRRDHQGRNRYLDCEWRREDGTAIVLEVDGSFHMRTEHWVRDMRRERRVVISGGPVLRCSSVELRLDPAAVLRDLRDIGVPLREE